jgi:hypothetical protein
MLALALALSPGAAGAQQPATQPAVRADVDKLPVSLQRIRRGLAREVTSEERFENFRLLTILQVYGAAPTLEFFTELEDETFKSAPGAVQYGGVTHSEFLSAVQPKNLPYGNARPPIANLSGNGFSLLSWAQNKRREEARKKAEEERKQRVLEMQRAREEEKKPD